MAKMGSAEQKRMAAGIAEELRVPEHDIVVHSSHIPVNHSEGQILMIIKGVPRRLNESSSITSNNASISRFYVFGRDEDRIRKGVAGYMESEFGLDRKKDS